MYRHHISTRYGFIGFFEPLREAPEMLAPHLEFGARMPEFLALGGNYFEDAVSNLPLFTEKELHWLSTYCEDEQAMRAAVTLGFACQAWVHRDWRNPRTFIPPQLARPACALASRLGMPPLLRYADYALKNWKRKDPRGGVTAENVEMLQHFNSRLCPDRFRSEQWFIAIHVEIEAAAGPLIEAALLIDWALLNKEYALVKKCLPVAIERLHMLRATLARMREHCVPEVYYEHVRPYLFGWSVVPGGVNYEGIGDAKWRGPQFFRGQTGAQSSIVPLMDIALDVRHDEEDSLSTHLDVMLREHTPIPHRTLLLEMKEYRRRRWEGWMEARRDVEIEELHRLAALALAMFRKQHYVEAIVNIARFAKHDKLAAHVAGASPKGTGGTDLIASLKKHISDTLDPADHYLFKLWEAEWRELYHSA